MDNRSRCVPLNGYGFEVSGTQMRLTLRMLEEKFILSSIEHQSMDFLFCFSDHSFDYYYYYYEPFDSSLSVRGIDFNFRC